jgi:hypothetical protein
VWVAGNASTDSCDGAGLGPLRVSAPGGHVAEPSELFAPPLGPAFRAKQKHTDAVS